MEAKGDASPVTEADRAAERALRGFLGTRFPDHGILGEEYGAERPDAEWLWVLDPIDGTRAFLTGRPLWGTLIGLMHRGEPVLGLIDQPVLGERWLGVKGQGTRFNGQPVRTRSCKRLAEAELACTAPEMFPEADRPGFDSLRAGARRISWGGDCYLYGLLSLGLLDVVAEATLKPWDWAALVPVVEGAGGSMTGWNGEALRMGCDGRVLALGDPALLDEAKASLAGGGPRLQ